MVLAKSKKEVGLGNALMNDRFGHGKGADRKKATAGIHRKDADGDSYITNAPKEASWVKMRSVTEQAALDDFLSTAELAGTDFTAEKRNNITVIHTGQRNPYLLSAAEERSAIRKQRANKDRLTIPRRPPWDESTTKDELEKRERDSLLDWRRGLAELQDSHELLMTPFERNLEVWRQLWRVIERSDLVVQIVDARNPLLFRSEDLEKYVKEVDPRKNNLLLVNKADMMTLQQREAWADYFEGQGIAYEFFSAALAKELNEVSGLEGDDAYSDEEAGEEAGDALAAEASKIAIQDEKDTDEDEDDDDDDDDDGDEEASSASGEELSGSGEKRRTRILTVDELEAVFLENAPELGVEEEQRKIQVGLVGYPNVGKSSTINALIGAKKVSVSATPGKTKHFQTIHLSPEVILCDCPGLVFPSFATTKAELVCNGILPIDQLREFTGPAALVAERIPQSFLEALYGIKILLRPAEEGGTGKPTAEELLIAYAVARGFTKTGQGQPDESRAARYILKDYVKGKLLFCQPPPADPAIDPLYFNRELYDEGHLPERRRAALALQDEAAVEGVEGTVSTDDPETNSIAPVQGAKSSRVDKRFFGPTQSNKGHLSMPFNHKYSEQGAAMGKQLHGRKQRTMIALEKNIDPSDVVALSGKKHFKGSRRKKALKADVE